MFNVDFSKDVQLVDGLVLVQFSEELYAPWFPRYAVQELDDILHSAGGACAAPWIDDLAKVIQADLYEPALRFMEHHGVQKDLFKGVMWIHSGILGSLSMDEKIAIIGHEVAHIALNHISYYIDENGGVDAMIKAYREDGVIPVMDNPERELEADAYSAAIYGKDIMHNALEQIINIDEVIEFNAWKYNISKEQVKAALRSRISVRLDALS